MPPHAQCCRIEVLVFIFVFAAAAVKCSVVGTAVLENIRGGSFIYAPVIRPDDIEHQRSDVDVADDVDVDVPSPTPDAPDDPIRSMARAALVSVQQLVLTYFQIFPETATMGVLQTVSEDTDVE